jgi:hypothetical protein
VAARARFYERLREPLTRAVRPTRYSGESPGISRQAISQVLKNDTE